MIDRPTIDLMKTIKEIRRDNARALATQGPAEFARRIGMSTQQVNQIVGPKPTRNIGGAIARRVEDAFGLSLGWLDVEHTSIQVDAAITRQTSGVIGESAKISGNKIYQNIEPGPERKGSYPLISWGQAGTWEAIVENFTYGDAEEWLDSPVEASKNSFYLRVRGESMYDAADHRSFRDGEIILVDPAATAEHGSFVVVKLAGEEEATFKQLVLEGGKQFLKALNPGWPDRIMQVNGNASLCGVVKTKIVHY